MIHKELYKNDISRSLNPAVSVTDNSESTIKVEIEEYVFTDEILNGLYKVIDAIRNRTVSHTGIWINGYYGSGKSHFLKYLNFCLTPAHREQALDRVLEAVGNIDPLDADSKLERSLPDYIELVSWLKDAEIDTVLFNMGDKIGDETDVKTTFAKAIWEEFNGFCGYQKFNLALAQYLEKPLQEKGKYDEFKAALAEDNFNWQEDADTLAVTELDYIMDKAAQVASFSTDVIRQKIADNAVNATPERLSEELKKHIAKKGGNYRILFFIDEVSQFIGFRQELLLQLQQIVTRFGEDTGRKAWVGCTAQQNLEEILDTCHIAKTSDDYGKIKGRFETRVPLQGTDTKYITQKRILDKTEDAVAELGKLYDQKKTALESQFCLPTGYNKYAGKEDFINYYPFVPYQFDLIIKVFDAFRALGYVDTEVKGNERSVLKVTHDTAQFHQEENIGGLMSFDMMFSAMFKSGLTHDGQKAIKNAKDIIDTYPEVDFGRKVIKLLFMLCNISDNEKLLLPANLDNIVTLMMTEIDQSKLQLKERTGKVLDYLIENSVVRKQSKAGKADVYCLLSEEESDVNQLIMRQHPSESTITDALKGIVTKYIKVNNREVFNGNPLTVGLAINERNILGQSNPNILVEFKTEAAYPELQRFVLNNEPKKMVYFMVGAYQQNNKLKNDFYWYCKVMEYMKEKASNASEQRTKTNSEFRTRASELFNNSIYPEFTRIIDTCPIVTEHVEVPTGLLNNKKATERYKTAFLEHCKNIYKFASYINKSDVPTTADGLKSKILREIDVNEYNNSNTFNKLTEAEQEIENFLNYRPGDVILDDILTHFNMAPYGWNEIATAYFVNELVRRHNRAYSYKGLPNVDRKTIANLILKEKKSFTITAATQISQQLVLDFIKAWKDIFNDYSRTYPLDSSDLFNMCYSDSDSPLVKIPVEWEKIEGNLKANHADILADELRKARNKISGEWHHEPDPEKFFKMIVSQIDEGKAMMDRCKVIVQFAHGPQMPAFKTLYDYVINNKDNFDFIKDEEGIKFVEELNEILSETDPINNLPRYRKRVEATKKRFIEIKKELTDNIRTAYANVLDELEQYAKDGNVPFDKKGFNGMIEAKCTTDNLYALKSNADVDDFRKDQLTKIDTRVPSPSVNSSETGSGITAATATAAPAPKKIKHVTFKDICKVQRITSLEELNNYVDSIRKKLIEELKDNDEIRVS